MSLLFTYCVVMLLSCWYHYTSGFIFSEKYTKLQSQSFWVWKQLDRIFDFIVIGFIVHLQGNSCTSKLPCIGGVMHHTFLKWDVVMVVYHGVPPYPHMRRYCILSHALCSHEWDLKLCTIVLHELLCTTVLHVDGTQFLTRERLQFCN